MSAGLVAIVALIYACVAITEYRNGNAPMSVVFIGYTLGNLGFIWSMVK